MCCKWVLYHSPLLPITQLLKLFLTDICLLLFSLTKLGSRNQHFPGWQCEEYQPCLRREEHSLWHFHRCPSTFNYTVNVQLFYLVFFSFPLHSFGWYGRAISILLVVNRNRLENLRDCTSVWLAWKLKLSLFDISASNTTARALRSTPRFTFQWQLIPSDTQTEIYSSIAAEDYILDMYHHAYCK